LECDWVDALELKAGSWRVADRTIEDPLFESYLIGSANYGSGCVDKYDLPVLEVWEENWECLVVSIRRS
jgi:hypothetical protein